MADDKKGAPDAVASTDAKTAPKKTLFPAGSYMNKEARVLNLIPQKGQDAEPRVIVPGGNVELSEEDTANKHIHHMIKAGMLVPAESAEAKAARESAENAQAAAEAAAAKKAASQ